MRRWLQLTPLSLLLACAPAAWATFPVVAGTLGSSRITQSTTDTVDLPASIASGDLVMIFHFTEGNSTRTVPSPWVEIFDSNSTGADGLTVAYLIASGGETSVVVTKTVTERFSAIAARITGWHGTTAPEISSSATGSSTTPDPDSVTASWGSDDNLFIAMEATDNDSFTPTAWPTNYTDNQITGPNAASSSGGAIATRNLAASNDNPGTFTITASDTWIAATAVVRPAAAGGGAAQPPTQMMMGVGAALAVPLR